MACPPSTPSRLAIRPPAWTATISAGTRHSSQLHSATVFHTIQKSFTQHSSPGEIIGPRGRGVQVRKQARIKIKQISRNDVTINLRVPCFVIHGHAGIIILIPSTADRNRSCLNKGTHGHIRLGTDGIHLGRLNIVNLSRFIVCQLSRPKCSNTSRLKNYFEVVCLCHVFFKY